MSRGGCTKLRPPYWIFLLCSVHASNDEERRNFCLLFLKYMANQRKGLKLYITNIHSWKKGSPCISRIRNFTPRTALDAVRARVLCICYCSPHLIASFSVTWLFFVYKFTCFLYLFYVSVWRRAFAQTLDFVFRISAIHQLFIFRNVYRAYFIGGRGLSVNKSTIGKGTINCCGCRNKSRGS